MKTGKRSPMGKARMRRERGRERSERAAREQREMRGRGQGAQKPPKRARVLEDDRTGPAKPDYLWELGWEKEKHAQSENWAVRPPHRNILNLDDPSIRAILMV